MFDGDVFEIGHCIGKDGPFALNFSSAWQTGQNSGGLANLDVSTRPADMHAAKALSATGFHSQAVRFAAQAVEKGYKAILAALALAPTLRQLAIDFCPSMAEPRTYSHVHPPYAAFSSFLGVGSGMFGGFGSSTYWRDEVGIGMVEHRHAEL